MKTNKNGRECAPWCTRDHQVEQPTGSCMSERQVTLNTGVEIRQYEHSATPQLVAKTGEYAAAFVHVDRLYAAEDLAQFVHYAAETPKAELRQLEANIRQAMTEAWPEQKQPEEEAEQS